MNRVFIQIVISFLICFYSAASLSTTNKNSTRNENAQKSNDLIQITVDNLTIDTNNLISASNTLSASISELSKSITTLSNKDINLNNEERKTLLEAAENISIASKALSSLASELPNTTQKLSKALPDILKQTHQPISDISQSIESLGKTVTTISSALPQALINTKEIVDKATNSILIKLYLFIGVFFSLLLLTMGLIIFYMHRKLVSPITTQLNHLSVLPSQLNEMTSYMKETSENLLTLQKNSQQKAT